MSDTAPDAASSWQGDLHMGRLVTRNNSATLRVEANQLVLDGPLGYHFVLPRVEVTEIRQAIGKFWKWSWPLRNGIRIYHSVSGLPEKLVFRSRRHTSAEDMLKKLKALEYRVP